MLFLVLWTEVMEEADPADPGLSPEEAAEMRAEKECAVRGAEGGRSDYSSQQAL